MFKFRQLHHSAARRLSFSSISHRVQITRGTNQISVERTTIRQETGRSPTSRATRTNPIWTGSPRQFDLVWKNQQIILKIHSIAGFLYFCLSLCILTLLVFCLSTLLHSHLQTDCLHLFLSIFFKSNSPLFGAYKSFQIELILMQCMI